MDNNQIHFRAEITIEKGKTEEFKKLIQDMSRTVEANEQPDTIEYQFYINGSETKCIVYEAYRNSEAAIAHNDGVASQILPRLFSISTITRFDVYENPSGELQKVLSSIGVQTYYSLFVGFKLYEKINSKLVLMLAYAVCNTYVMSVLEHSVLMDKQSE